MKVLKQSFAMLPLALLVLFPAAAGSKSPWEDADSTKLFDKATMRFEGKLGKKEFASFRDTVVDFRTGPKKVDKVAASDLVYNYARASDTRSRVEISTSKGNGATIRYQTLGQRVRNETPTTAKGLTALTEQMYIGRYYIWAVRSDRITSDSNSEFEIVSQSEAVKLQEK
jgi:hypothetical protein